MRKMFFSGKMGKVYTLGIFLVCGLLLSSVEECEDMSLAEQEAAWARSQAGQTQGSGDQGQGTGNQGQGAGSQGQGAGNQGQGAGSQGQSLADQGQSSFGQASDSGSSQTASGTSSAADTSAAFGTQTGTSQGSFGASDRQAAADSQSWESVVSQFGATDQSGGTTSQGAAPSDTGTASSGTGAGGTASSSGTQSQTGGSAGANTLAAISGKEWKLSELRLSDKTITLDRAKLNAEGAGDIFTMTMDGTRISGKAAPNRYNTVYQAGANNSLTLQPMITTLMASSFDPERLQEHEYYQYLSKVKSWKLNQNKLELYTTDDNNKEAVLVYVN